MTKIAHLNPHDNMKQLKLDDCKTRTASIKWKVAANVKMHEGAVRNCQRGGALGNSGEMLGWELRGLRLKKNRNKNYEMERWGSFCD
jgi:hypothetical protein